MCQSPTSRRSPLEKLSKRLVEVGVALDQLQLLDEEVGAKAQTVLEALLTFTSESLQKDPELTAVANAKRELTEARTIFTDVRRAVLYGSGRHTSRK
jgi:hypothetical protein